MSIPLDDRRRKRLIARFQALVQEEFDEDVSAFRAEQTLNFFLAALGPQIYNQAVQDARKFMQERLDDLDGEVYHPEGA